MLSNEVIDLISISYANNDIGDSIETKTYTQVFADELSIMQSEFYQAAATGLKPEKKFEISFHDYNNEPAFRHDSKEYTIIRTFKKGVDRIELTGEGITGTEVR